MTYFYVELYHFSLKIGVPYDKAVFMQVLPTSYSLNNNNKKLWLTYCTFFMKINVDFL